jgi:2-alkyl-3-oxoalkanoate reductase
MAGIAVVTGAAGFMGRAFSAALRERRWEVRGVDVRPGPNVTTGDVSRPGAWTNVLEGADLVVHAAAMVIESGDTATFWRVNVEGTRTVLEEAARAGVGRVLHLSSKVVHGREFLDGVDEAGPVRMTGNPYTDTKVSSEHQALMAAASGRVPVTIIRPGDVYGPHSGPWTIRPVQAMRQGIFVLFQGGRGIISPTYVDDVVDGGLAAALHPDGAGEIFHITGGVGVEASEFFGHYAGMLDRPLRSIPGPAASVLAGPVDVISRTLGRRSPFSPRTLEYLTHPGTYSIAKAQQMLGWEPKVSLEEGMARTRTWLIETGLVPDPERAERDEEPDEDVEDGDFEELEG